MNWRDAYRQGSFRGVPFRSQTNAREGGRRVEQHEYPGRDTSWAEDLGRRAARFALEVFVAGEDYRAARERLIRALNAAGAGTLVHPWDGAMTVSVDTWSCRDSTDEGGVAFFSIEFVEAGAIAQALSQPDTGVIATAAAASVQAAAPERFAEKFSVAGVPSFVEAAAARLVRDTAVAAAISGGLQGGVGPALRAFEAGLTLLPTSALSLVRHPLALGRAVVGLIAALGALGGSAQSRIAGLSSLVAFSGAAVIGTTPARERERANAGAYSTLVATVAAAELVRAIAEAPIASYQDAVRLRDASADLLEDRLTAAADAGDDAARAIFAELLRVMVADVTARGGTLARVYGYVLPRTAPALVIANRLYGAAAVVDRADDLVARNRVRHPGFVDGGRSIEVLEASGG